MGELEDLASQIRACQLCRLARSRTHAVPGVGPAPAKVMFIGEGPGAREDEAGLPFVGPSGQLLDRQLARIGLSRDDVFITNVVKCRPPQNRDPEPDEVKVCMDAYLRPQLRLVSPQLLVTLGRHALFAVNPRSESISRAHGQPVRGRRYTLIPAFHPAAALRSPQMMKLFEADFDAIAAYLAAQPAQPAG